MILPVYFLGFGPSMAIAPYLRCRSARYSEYTAPRVVIEVKYFLDGSASAHALVKQVNSCAIIISGYQAAFRD